MKLYSFGGVTFPTAYQDQDLPIEARAALMELPDGAFDMDGQTVVKRPSIITYRFPVEPTVDSSVDALLTRMVGSRGVLKAVLRDGTTYRQTFAKLVSVRRPRSPFDKLVQQIEVSFQQDYPFWMATADEPKYLDNGEELDDGWNLDGNYTAVTIDADQETPTITNSGLLPIARGKIILRPNSPGTISGITILNKANMMELRYLGTVAYPQTLVLDFLSKRATLDMVDAYENIQLPYGQWDWLRLEVGANILQIDVTGRTGTLALEWHWAKTYA